MRREFGSVPQIVEVAYTRTEFGKIEEDRFQEAQIGRKALALAMRSTSCTLKISTGRRNEPYVVAFWRWGPIHRSMASALTAGTPSAESHYLVKLASATIEAERWVAQAVEELILCRPCVLGIMRNRSIFGRSIAGSEMAQARECRPTGRMPRRRT